MNYICNKGLRSENLDLISFFTLNDKMYLIILDGTKETKKDDLIKYSKYLLSSLKGNDNKYCIEKYIRKGGLMYKIKASLSICIMDESSLRVYQAGDCRVYINGKLITEDHSIAWRSIGGETQEKIRKITILSHRSKLYNLVKKSNFFIQEHIINLKAGDHIIACTDGVWKDKHEEIIQKNKKIDYQTIDNNDNASLIEWDFPLNIKQEYIKLVEGSYKEQDKM